MTSKLRIRVGDVDLEFEGSEEFIKKDLLDLVRAAAALSPQKKQRGSQPADTDASSESDESNDIPKTTGGIATILDVKSGSDLLEAAAAFLALSQGKATFSRGELLTAMKSATHFYRTSYSANLTKSFKRALSSTGFLSETAKDSYALKAAARKRLEQKFADA